MRIHGQKTTEHFDASDAIDASDQPRLGLVALSEYEEIEETAWIFIVDRKLLA